jgi:hypothetical protein
MVENMADGAKVRKAKDMILERATDPPATETSDESRGLKA